MPQINQTLAQAIPAAATETTLYTVPAATAITPFPVKIYNSGTSVATWYVRHKLLGAANASSQIADGSDDLQPKETRIISLLPLSATDEVTVYSSTGLVTFQLAGQVNT